MRHPGISLLLVVLLASPLFPTLLQATGEKNSGQVPASLVGDAAGGPAADTDLVFPNREASIFNPDTENGLQGPPLRRILFAFLLMGGIAAYAVYWARRKKSGPGMVPGRNIEVLETRPIGNRQYLMHVKCGHAQFLLGVSPDGMSTLATLDPEEADAPAPSFSELIPK